MNIFYTSGFAKMLEKLPRKAQELYLHQENIFRMNWRDPRLHLKKLKGESATFSFRITRNYRAFFYLRASDETVFYVIGHRKDIHRKLAD